MSKRFYIPIVMSADEFAQNPGYLPTQGRFCESMDSAHALANMTRQHIQGDNRVTAIYTIDVSDSEAKAVEMSQSAVFGVGRVSAPRDINVSSFMYAEYSSPETTLHKGVCETYQAQGNQSPTFVHTDVFGKEAAPLAKLCTQRAEAAKELQAMIDRTPTSVYERVNKETSDNLTQRKYLERNVIHAYSLQGEAHNTAINKALDMRIATGLLKQAAKTMNYEDFAHLHKIQKAMAENMPALPGRLRAEHIIQITNCIYNSVDTVAKQVSPDVAKSFYQNISNEVPNIVKAAFDEHKESSLAAQRPEGMLQVYEAKVPSMCIPNFSDKVVEKRIEYAQQGMSKQLANMTAIRDVLKEAIDFAGHNKAFMQEHLGHVLEEAEIDRLQMDHDERNPWLAQLRERTAMAKEIISERAANMGIKITELEATQIAMHSIYEHHINRRGPSEDALFAESQLGQQRNELADVLNASGITAHTIETLEADLYTPQGDFRDDVDMYGVEQDSLDEESLGDD